MRRQAFHTLLRCRCVPPPPSHVPAPIYWGISFTLCCCSMLRGRSYLTIDDLETFLSEQDAKLAMDMLDENKSGKVNVQVRARWHQDWWSRWCWLRSSGGLGGD